MNSTTVIIGVIAIILAIGVILLIALNVRLSQTRINPGNCPSNEGEFGVTGGYSYRNSSSETAILSKCGPNNSDPCQASALTIAAAIAYCNTYVNICDAFVYSVAAKQVAIVDTTATYTPDTTYDLFKRQYATLQL